jgi:hypothetical protein
MLTRTFAGSDHRVLLRRLGWQISPGENMIFPHTTAAFTLPQRSGWASSCCADSPWGSALIGSFCSSVRRFALRLLSDSRPPFCPCRRLLLFKLSVMTTLQIIYRGLAPHKIMPMPGTQVQFHAGAKKPSSYLTCFLPPVNFRISLK